MNIIRTFVPESQENYNHLAYCPITMHAAAVDPYDAEHLMNLAAKHHLSISQIWITHEHGDHIREVAKLKALTNATVYAPQTCSGKFLADRWLKNKAELSLGKSTITQYLTPGHTPGHGIYLYSSTKAHKSFVVCADTLFNAGVGNVYSGDVNELYNTIQALHRLIQDDTRLYPGHDYMLNNLKFVLHHFPSCEAADTLLSTIVNQNHDTRQVQCFGNEKLYNPFLALNADWLVNHPALQSKTERERFITIREWRNNW